MTTPNRLNILNRLSPTTYRRNEQPQPNVDTHTITPQQPPRVVDRNDNTNDDQSLLTTTTTTQNTTATPDATSGGLFGMFRRSTTSTSATEPKPTHTIHTTTTHTYNKEASSSVAFLSSSSFDTYTYNLITLEDLEEWGGEGESQ